MTELYARKNDKGQMQTLKDHLTGTASLAESFGRDVLLPYSTKIAGLLHDIGKAGISFQNRLLNMNIPADHSTAGGRYVAERAGKRNFAAEIIELTILSHHGGLMDCIGELGTLPFFNRLTQKEIDDISFYITQFAADMNIDISAAISEIKDRFIQMKKTGECGYVKTALFVLLFYSCLIDADRIDSAFAFSKEEYQEINFDFKLLSNWLDQYVERLPKGRLSNVRNEIYSACSRAASKEKGLFRLKVATGGGKTISSLKFAAAHAALHGQKRIIYVVPYLSIIEQNAETVRRIITQGGFDRESVMECHSNVVMDKPLDESMKNNGYMPQDNYNGSVIFTTMVQFLENIYGNGTSGIRRFHHYTNSVIIFDEIQSLPMSCTHLFCALADFLKDFGSSVVLCSATQPQFDNLPDVNGKRNSFNLEGVVDIVEKEHPELERTQLISLFYDRNRIKVFNPNEVSALIMKEYNQSNSILVISNTKSIAKKLYSLLNIEKQEEIYYLSTDLCAAHRLKTIETIKIRLKEKKKTLCISTQLIEAGVDLDFDCVFRYAAGADSMIQAAGRCNREGKLIDDNGQYIKGKVYIIKGDHEEKLDRLKDIQRARDVFIETYIGLEETNEKWLAEQYFRSFYIKNGNVLSYPIDKSKAGFDTNMVELLGANMTRYHQINDDDKGNVGLRASFKTAADSFSVIEGRQIGILVPYEESVCHIDHFIRNDKVDYSVLKKLQRYTVNVYINKLSCYYTKEIGESGIFVLTDPAYYDEIMGLSTRKTADALFDA